MGAVKKAWGWVAHKTRAWREMVSGDDLQDAQEHRGDSHEFKPNVWSGLGGGGGG